MRSLLVRGFLQTRGTARASDYTFLGSAPEETWWRAYRDATAFEHPTVLVTSDGAEWAAYLSGIPSARVDAVGTVVRYTLVLDGPCGTADTGCVLAGVAAWLEDVAAGPRPPGGGLSAALDARFSADLVERMITEPYPNSGLDIAPRYCTDASIVRSHLLAALGALPVPPPAADEPGDWLGAVAAAACRAAFVARVAALLDGGTGRALLLNLIGSPDDTRPLLDDASLAVLVESEGPLRPTALRPAVVAKKAPAATARRATVAAVAGTAMLPVMATALVLAALIVTVLVLLL